MLLPLRFFTRKESKSSKSLKKKIKSPTTPFYRLFSPLQTPSIKHDYQFLLFRRVSIQLLKVESPSQGVPPALFLARNRSVTLFTHPKINNTRKKKGGGDKEFQPSPHGSTHRKVLTNVAELPEQGIPCSMNFLTGQYHISLKTHACNSS